MTQVPATISERVPLPAIAVPGFAASAALTPADILRMIRGRLVLIIILSLFLSAVAVGVFLLIYLKYPTYSASAIIECVSNAPKPGYSVELQRVAKDEHERFLLSQSLYAKQPDLLARILESPEVRGTQWYQLVPKDEQLTELDNELNCSPIRDSNYIRIAMGTRSPKDPHVIVNKLVDVYLQEAHNRAVGQFRDELTEYKKEENDTQKKIEAQIARIREFVGNMSVGVLGQENRPGQTVVEQELLSAQQTFIELQLQTQELEGIQRIYDDPMGPGVTPEDRQLVELNPQVQMLQNQVMALDQEIKARRRKFGPKHREVQYLESRLIETDEQLQRVREQKLQESLDLKQEQVRTAYLNSQHAMSLAEERLIEVKAKQADIERKLAEYRRLNDELDFFKTAQEKAADYIRDVNRIIQEQSAIRIVLVQPARPPIERSNPKWYMGVGGIVLALLLSVGLALLLELADTSVRTANDVVRYLNLPILGTVPEADDEEVQIERIETAVCELPHSMIAEAFRTIRTSLQFSAPAERLRTIVVTSPRPEDGKTTVACNLAACLALGGRRILLVDANFRRPAVRRVFGVQNPEGLSNILIGARRLENMTAKTQLSNLDVLVSGSAPPNPAEQLGSPMMRQLIDAATREYDQVIIDAPPVLLASDASVLATLVDGVILVLRAKGNSRGVAQRAISVLLHVNAHMFGAVLNAAQVQRGGYFREQLRTFYEYQTEESLADQRSGTALPPWAPDAVIDDRTGSPPENDPNRP